MLRHLRPYAMATLWAVMRRGVFVATLQAMGADGPFKSAAAGELQTSLIAAYYGKCHVLDELVWLRSYENGNIWWDHGRLSIEQWYLDPRNSDEVERFYKGIEFQIDAADPNLLRAWLIRAMDAFVDKGKSALPEPNVRFSISSILRRNISSKAKRILKGILRIIRRYPHTLTLAAKALSETGVKVNIVEVSKIESLISKFHMKSMAE